MAEVRLNWDKTSPLGGEIFVELEGQPDEHWRDAFRRTSALWSTETRSQTWDEVDVTADLKAIVVIGASDDTDHSALMAYVTELVDAANSQAAEERARTRLREELETEQVQREEVTSSRLANELRRPTD